MSLIKWGYGAFNIVWIFIALQHLVPLTMLCQSYVQLYVTMIKLVTWCLLLWQMDELTYLFILKSEWTLFKSLFCWLPTVACNNSTIRIKSKAHIQNCSLGCHIIRYHLIEVTLTTHMIQSYTYCWMWIHGLKILSKFVNINQYNPHRWRLPL